MQARGIVLSLSGIDPNLLPAALGEFQQELPVTVYLALFDTGGNTINAPLIAWAGMMDSPAIEVDGSTATISISLRIPDGRNGTCRSTGGTTRKIRIFSRPAISGCSLSMASRKYRSTGASFLRERRIFEAGKCNVSPIGRSGSKPFCSPIRCASSHGAGGIAACSWRIQFLR